MSIDYHGYIGPFLHCKKRDDKEPFPAWDHDEKLSFVQSECGSDDFKAFDVFTPNKRNDFSMTTDSEVGGYRIMRVLEINDAIAKFIKEYNDQIKLVHEHYGQTNVRIVYGFVEYWR